ncbi:hypothetical protein YC2023_054259 [Brassica napus]
MNQSYFFVFSFFCLTFFSPLTFFSCSPSQKKERSGERRFTPTCSLLWILEGRRRSPVRPKLPPSLRSLSHRSSDINSDDEDDDYFTTTAPPPQPLRSASDAK